MIEASESMSRETKMSFRPAFLWAVGLAATLLLGLIAGPASAKTLKIATIVPEGTSWMVEMRKAAAEIKKRTDGRVKIKFYPGGVMGNDKTVLRKVRAGQLHGGAFTGGALADISADIELYSLPFLFRNYDEVSYVRERMDKKIAAKLEAKGFVPLAITDGGFAYVMSQQPIRAVEDMKGSKVWLVEDDRMTAMALDLAGVAPVPLPIADVYTALQTGLIETVAAPPQGAIAFQWHTEVDYLTDVPVMYLVGVVAIDKKAFSKLTPADQKVVREVVGEASRRLDEENRLGEANAREALQNQGVEFVTANSDAEVERWYQISDEATQRLLEQNIYSPETIQEILSLLKEYRAAQEPEASP